MSENETAGFRRLYCQGCGRGEPLPAKHPFPLPCEDCGARDWGTYPCMPNIRPEDANPIEPGWDPKEPWQQ